MEKATINRKGFSFYKSYWDSLKELKTDREKIEFIEIICKTQFLEENINSIKPSTNNLKLLFTSMKHSLEASVLGYCSKLEIDYNSYPWQGGSEGGSVGGSQPPWQQVEEKGEVKEKEKEKEYLSLNNFKEWNWQEDESFAIWLYSKKDLMDYQGKNLFNIQYVDNKKESVIFHCESKGVKYKDYKATLQNWINKDISGGKFK